MYVTVFPVWLEWPDKTGVMSEDLWRIFLWFCWLWPKSSQWSAVKSTGWDWYHYVTLTQPCWPCWTCSHPSFYKPFVMWPSCQIQQSGNLWSAKPSLMQNRSLGFLDWCTKWRPHRMCKGSSLIHISVVWLSLGTNPTHSGSGADWRHFKVSKRTWTPVSWVTCAWLINHRNNNHSSSAQYVPPLTHYIFYIFLWSANKSFSTCSVCDVLLVVRLNYIGTRGEKS